jgi:hypothetical protein
MVYFLWWNFQLASSVLELPFVITGLAGMLIGAACGIFCRAVSRSMDAYTDSSIVNTVAWTCLGSIGGYCVGGLLVGVNSGLSPLVLPALQAAAIFPAMVLVPHNK